MTECENCLDEIAAGVRFCDICHEIEMALSDDADMSAEFALD